MVQLRINNEELKSGAKIGQMFNSRKRYFDTGV
jgi:hypothetical protein